MPINPHHLVAAAALALISHPVGHAAPTLTPELSTELTQWSGLDLVYVSTVHHARTTPGSTTATVTYRSAQPVSSLPGRVFIRVSGVGE
jgi:hypothetical protein